MEAHEASDSGKAMADRRRFGKFNADRAFVFFFTLHFAVGRRDEENTRHDAGARLRVDFVFWTRTRRELAEGHREAFAVQTSRDRRSRRSIHRMSVITY